MNVGLPGTGIGGLFYVLLALAWLPARELWRAARGRAGPGRWRPVAVQAALAGGILGALYGEAWLLARASGLLGASGLLPGAGFLARDLGLERIAPALGLAPLVILGLLLGGLRALRLLVPVPPPVPGGRPIAAASPEENRRARAAGAAVLDTAAAA